MTPYVNEDPQHSKTGWVLQRRCYVCMCGFDVDYVHLWRTQKHLFIKTR